MTADFGPAVRVGNSSSLTLDLGQFVVLKRGAVGFLTLERTSFKSSLNMIIIPDIHQTPILFRAFQFNL